MRILLSLFFLCFVSVGHAQIEIGNIDAGSVVRYPVVALQGTAKGTDIAIGADWQSAIRFPVVAGRFSGFVELKPGPNLVVLQSGRNTMRYRLTYQPATSQFKVLTIFLKAKDEEPRYFSNRLGDTYDIRGKLDTAMKLMQSATAEAMHAEGEGRKTFNLEFDPKGKVVVHVVELPKTGEELRAMENGASWGYIYEQLKQRFPENSTHWNGVLGFTRYDRDRRVAAGHYALGGGSLALFGSGTMQWWPDSLKEVPTKLFDTYMLDTNLMFDDSNRRQTTWANVSTAYGAMLHEMGHTFGLPHSADRFSVMSRGFDFFSRWFTPVEAISRGISEKVSFKPEERMRWDPFFAARLSMNPYFQPDRAMVKPAGAPSVKIEGDAAVLHAPDGVRLWGAIRDDLPHVWERNKDAKMPTSLRLSIPELRQKLGSDKDFEIVLVDGLGQQAQVRVPAKG